MARQDPQFDAGTGRTGVTRRPLPTGNKSSTAHLDRIAFVAIGGLGLVVLLVISGTFSPPPVVESQGPTATAGATATEVAVLPTFSAELPASPDPTPTLSPALTPSPPTPSPTLSPSPSPTLSSSPSPSPTPTPTSPLIPSPSPLGTVGPVVPETGLLIVEPADGSTTFEDVVIVRGLAAPGSEITRDVPFWFDEHTTADSVGRWSFVLSLNTGANSFTFRVGDDRATDRTLTINHIAS